MENTLLLTGEAWVALQKNTTIHYSWHKSVRDNVAYAYQEFYPMKYFITASLLLISSCGHSSKSQAIDMCDTTIQHTLFTNDSHDVYIYYPEPNVAAPEIWEGPICTQSKKTHKVCSFDEALIGPTKFLGNDSLAINGFSGSESWDWVMNLETCEIEQK